MSLLRALVLIVNLSVPSIAAGASALEVDLARGLEKAAKGELRDRSLMHRLERGFLVSRDLVQQIQIANVLTYAPQSSGFRDKYVDFVLAQSQGESVLGKEELYRLRRLRAERLFEAGKFAEARRDFEALMQVQQPLVREFAVLKTGWCYMNAEQPHLAWQLWIEQAEKTIAEKKDLPPNLAHSLGQALVENSKRTKDDFRRLGNLKLSEAALDQVWNGMEQGSDTVDTPAEMKEWVEQVEFLRWKPLLANRLLEKMGGTGNRSCLFLPWVTLLPETKKEVPALAYQVTENCLVWLKAASNAPAERPSKAQTKTQKKAVTSKELSAAADNVLKTWLPKQPWSKAQMRVPFTYYGWTNQWFLACEVGLGWISEPKNPEHRSRAPIAEITETCKKAVDSESSAQKIARYFEPSSAALPYLSNAKDPLLFVALALLEEPAFEKLLLANLVSRAKEYEPTLLPVLALERLESQKQLDSAERLWAGLVSKQAEDPAQSSVWRQILQRRMKALKDSKASPEEQYALLEKTLYSPADPKLSEFGYGLWLQYLAAEVELARATPLEAEKKLLSNGRAKSTAEGLLTTARTRAYPKLAAASVEMMGWFGLWKVLWESLSGPQAVAYSKVRSEALEVRLLSAVVKGELTIPSDSEQKDPSLKFIVELGSRLKAPSEGWVASIKPVGSSIVAKDATYLQSLDQKHKRLLVEKKNAKAAAKQALDWIQHLDRQKRDIAKRTWCHELFFHAAQDSLVQFCDQARDKIPYLKKAVQGAGSTEAQWAEFFSAFEKKLEDCTNKKDARRASL